jgi:hypothetical protein
LEGFQEEDMSTIVQVYPAHIVLSQAEVRLVADETANASPTTIKSDEQRIEAAQEVEADKVKTTSVNLVA